MIGTTVDICFFDAGGVLVNPNWERVHRILSNQGLKASVARLAEADHPAKRLLDRSELVAVTSDNSRMRRYFELVVRGTGVPMTSSVCSALLDAIEREHAEHNLWQSVPADVSGTLATLRARGIKLAVVSNSNGSIATLLASVGLAHHFDAIVDSGNEGVEKPSPRIFEIALERVCGQPQRAVHVGDFYNIDVVGARAAGIEAVLLDVANLYADEGCARIRTLGELTESPFAPARAP
jgi:HAD superfamily hydrolase (TIGR01509 family)